MSSSQSPSDKSQLITASWLTAPATQAVFRALQAGGATARVVGGAPRNTLAGLPVSDIDLATTATPAEIISAADAAGLKCVPTGLAHGTVTIISAGQPFEVTTLREDVATDGRHATVAFTDDWIRDAERRDFTINALYVDADGVIFDPVGGLEDLRRGKVRFIGDAAARIDEDYLRILRFFRFTSAFSNEAPDATALAACEAAREGLQRLSGERIRSELLRLLQTPRAAEMVEAMAAAELFRFLFEPPVRVDHLRHLIEIEDMQSLASEPIRRLAALAVCDTDDARALSERLRLSNDEKARLIALANHRATPERHAPEQELQARLYRIGVEAYCDTELLTWVRSGDDATTDWRFQRLELPERWEVPQLPVSGGDIVALGIPAGPQIGKILSNFERWWIASGFPDDREMVNGKLADLAKDY